MQSLSLHRVAIVQVEGISLRTQPVHQVDVLTSEKNTHTHINLGERNVSFCICSLGPKTHVRAP